MCIYLYRESQYVRISATVLTSYQPRPSYCCAAPGINKRGNWFAVALSSVGQAATVANIECTSARYRNNRHDSSSCCCIARTPLSAHLPLYSEFIRRRNQSCRFLPLLYMTQCTFHVSVQCFSAYLLQYCLLLFRSCTCVDEHPTVEILSPYDQVVNPTRQNAWKFHQTVWLNSVHIYIITSLI